MPEGAGESQELQIEAESNLSEMNRLLDKDDADHPEPTPKEKETPAPKDRKVRGEESVDDLELSLDDEEEPEPRLVDEDEDEDQLEQEEEPEEEQELRDSLKPQLLKDLEKEYPDILKKHKPLRNAIIRHEQFSQLFVDPRQAQEAVQLNEDYRGFENEILNGDPAKVIRSIQQTSEKGYKRFISGVLPALYDLDRATYSEVVFPVFANLLRKARVNGEASGNENLVRSTKHICSLIWPELKGGIPNFDSKRVEADPEIDSRAKEVEERERRYEMRVRTDFIGGIKGNNEKLLKKRIEKGLDPDNTLNSFLKASIIDKTMKDVQELMDEDVHFNRTMDHLLERGRRSGYSNEYKTRMIGTFIGRATQLIGPIRRRYFNQALGRVEKTKEGKAPPMRRPVGEAPSGGGKKIRSSEIDWASTSDLDIMNRTPKLKRK